MLRHKNSSSSGRRHCCHSSRGRSTLSKVPLLHRSSVVQPQIAAAAAAATDGDRSADTVLQSLRGAFGAAPLPPDSTQHVDAVEPASPPSERADRSAAGSNNSGGSGRRASSVQQQQSATTTQAGASEPKKRRGRFGDLIDALEHELLHPEQASTSSRKPSSISSSSSSNSSSHSSDSSRNSSDRSRSSRGAAEAHAAVLPPLASPTAAAAARSPVRRIRRGSAASQQQQSPAATAAPTPRSQQPSITQHAQQQQQPEVLPPWLFQQQQSADAAAAGGGRRVKVYAPVAKGDLLLPGGPAWSALRRHVVAAGANPSLPTLDCIVLVEGDSDQQAVGRAVNAPVYVCDGTRALKEHVRPELTLLTQVGRRLVVLTDPDERGRELRLHLDDTLAPLTTLHHAFVPERAGTSDADGPVHAAGNRGIEHVVPLGVQKALAVAAPSWPRDRAVWGLADLQRLALANAFDAGHEGVVRGPGGAAARRRQLCALLGLGRCSAAQLVTALNRFFSEEQLAAALQQLDDMAAAAAAAAAQ